jgi:hypothetical protein
MGGFQSTLTGIVRGARRIAAPSPIPARLLLAAALLGSALSTGWTGEAVAEPPKLEPAQTTTSTSPPTEARVSTSPGSESGAPPVFGPALATGGDGLDEEPLTRAAARHRVETASPTKWLARFGSVTVERRD